MANNHQEKKLVSSSNMKVEIQSKKWIKPATPTPPHLHNHQLSSIDQLQPPFFVPILFRFDTGNETDTIITRLEESLAKVLTLYYPFAGEHDANESVVSCGDQGVEFVVASVDRKIGELAGGEDEKKALLSGLERILSFSGVDFTPVISVQVNIFTCGGLVIGFSFNHKVCDTFTVTAFLNAWATACRLGELDDKSPRPSFNISAILPPKDHLKKPPSSEPKTQNPKKQPEPPKFVSKRYIFTGEVLSKLKLSTNYYSRVELVTAIITRSLVNIEWSRSRSRGTKVIRPLVISQPMNLRAKIPFSIEDNLCGNLCTRLNSAVNFGNGKLPELGEVAGVIRDSVRSVGSEMGKVRDWNELSEKVEGAYVEFNEEVRKGENVNVVVRFSSWCRFGLYEVDFGWGKPSLVCAVPVPGVMFIVLMDCKSDVGEGGIEAWVCLNEDDMAQFQNQEDILAYASF